MSAALLPCPHVPLVEMLLEDYHHTGELPSDVDDELDALVEGRRATPPAAFEGERADARSAGPGSNASSVPTGAIPYGEATSAQGLVTASSNLASPITPPAEGRDETACALCWHEAVYDSPAVLCEAHAQPREHEELERAVLNNARQWANDYDREEVVPMSPPALWLWDAVAALAEGGR